MVLSSTLLNTTFYCCPDCYKQLTQNSQYTVKQIENDCFCDCTEIDLGLYKPTPCAVCKDPEMAGCPMHLYYIKVTSAETHNQR